MDVKELICQLANPESSIADIFINAASNDHSEIVKLLLEAGANPNVPDPYGNTALSLTRNPEIKNLLIRAGAKT